MPAAVCPAATWTSEPSALQFPAKGALRGALRRSGLSTRVDRGGSVVVVDAPLSARGRERMSRGRTQSVLTTRFADGASHRRPDDLIVEEPLEIHLDGNLVATTMRTPGHDFELAAGFCFTEGLLAGALVQTCRYCGTGSAVDTEFNIVSVDTGGQAPVPTPRVGTTTSACGLCGSMSIDELTERLQPLVAPTRFDLGMLAEVPERARIEQPLFAATGAVHAAATFDVEGAIGVVREDIGRHNAVDKVVGRLLLDNLVDRVVATDVFAHHADGTLDIEGGRCMHRASGGEQRLLDPRPLRRSLGESIARSNRVGAPTSARELGRSTSSQRSPARRRGGAHHQDVGDRPWPRCRR